jgi:hypothetical protein
VDVCCTCRSLLFTGFIQARNLPMRINLPSTQATQIQTDHTQIQFSDEIEKREDSGEETP